MTRKNWNAPQPGQAAVIVQGSRGAYLARYPFGPHGVASLETATAAAAAFIAVERAKGRHGLTARTYSGAAANSFVWVVNAFNLDTRARYNEGFSSEPLAFAKADELAAGRWMIENIREYVIAA